MKEQRRLQYGKCVLSPNLKGRRVFVKEAEGKQYEVQAAIDIVKLESDKQVAVVQQKLDKIGGKFKKELYDRLYEYYRSGAKRAAGNGRLNEEEFNSYKKDMLKKTDEILKQFVPTEAQVEAKKRESEAVRELMGESESAELPLGEIPKELPEDTPAEKLQEKLEEYGKLSQAVNSQAQKKLGDINGFFTKLQAYYDARNQHRAAYTWDKITGIFTTSDDDKNVAALQEAKGETEGKVRKKKDELEKKKTQIEKYGKSVQAVLAKKRGDLVAARDAEVKKAEEEKAKQGAAYKEKEDRYKEFRDQEKQLEKKKAVLEKSKVSLEELRSADDSPANAARKAESKRNALERVWNTESDKEVMLTRLLARPDLTDEGRETIESELTEIRSRKKKADDGKRFLDRGLDASRVADAKLSQDEQAVAGNLATVDGTLEGFVNPSLQSLEEHLLAVRSQMEQYADCAEGIRDGYNRGIESIDAVSKQTDDFILQCSLANSMSLSVLDDAYGKLQEVKIDKQGVFGACWDGIKELYQGTVGKILSVPGDLLTDAGKWIARQGKLFQNDARQMEGWGKYILIPVSEVAGAVTGFAGGACELAGGVLNIGGRPYDFLEGIGALLTINKQTGEIGDFSHAGNAWKALGKGLISYDEFAEGHVSTGVGKIGANILSLFIGSKGVEKAAAVSTAARAAQVAKVTAAGGKAGFLTGRLAEAGAFFRVLGQETVKMPAFLRRGGDLARAGNLSKAAGESLGAIEKLTAGGAKSTAEMASQGSKALKSAEGVERSALAAEAMRLAEAETLANEMKEVGRLAAEAKKAGNLAKMEELAARAKDLKSRLGAAKEAARAAGDAAGKAAEAAEKMRLAQAAIKEAQAAEAALAKAEAGADAAARSRLAANATKKGQAAEQALEAAEQAAKAAEKAAKVVPKSSGAMNVARSMLEALPGGKSSVARYRLAEGAGAKTGAALKGAAEVTARTGAEALRLTYRGAKFLVVDLPLGALRGLGRFMKALPKITRAIIAEGGPGFALKINKVGRALKTLEKEGPAFERLAETFESRITRKPEIVGKILDDIKADAVFGKRFKGLNWDEARALIAEDASLNRLGAKHPEFAKVFENRALARFLETNGEAAAALMRVREATETVMAFGARDKRVAEIINRLYGRKLYEAEAGAAEVGVKAKASAKAEAGASEAGTPEAKAAEKFKPRVGQQLKDDYAAMYKPGEPQFARQVEQMRLDLVDDFGKKYASETAMSADDLAAAFQKEFEGLKFEGGKSFGEIKIGEYSFRVETAADGAMKIRSIAAEAPRKAAEELAEFTAAFESRVTRSLKDEHTAFSIESRSDASALAKLAKNERELVEAFIKEWASEAGMTPKKMSVALEKEFPGLKFERGKNLGEVEIAGEKFIFRAAADGKLKLMTEAEAAAETLAIAAAKSAPGAAAAETAAEIGRARALGQYMRGRINGAKELYARWKANPSAGIKEQVYRLVAQNAAIVANIPLLEALDPNKDIDERIEDLENRISQIEQMEELPPDLVLPDEVEEMILKSREPKIDAVPEESGTAAPASADGRGTGQSQK